MLNKQNEIDIKVYISPDDQNRAKRLFDGLMITNLEAHSKLKQVPFYTLTLLDRLSVIFKDMLDEFIANTPSDFHTERQFARFLSTEKFFSPAQAKEMLRSEIQTSALDASVLKKYVAVALKDASYPLTMDLLGTTIFRACLYLEPSASRFTSECDFRNAESTKFAAISNILVEETGIANWVSHTKGRSLTNEQHRPVVSGIKDRCSPGHLISRVFCFLRFTSPLTKTASVSFIAQRLLRCCQANLPSLRRPQPHPDVHAAVVAAAHV